MKTNRKILAVMMLPVLAFMSSCSEKQDMNPTTSGTDVSSAERKGTTTTTTTTTTGNGAVSGSHYSLNIIGVPKGKTADMTGNMGHRIFVNSFGTTKIMLNEGAEFQVLDANGTDGIAKFQLPNPDPANTGTTKYSVFARAVGTPGGTASMSTCATDPLTGMVVCSNLTYVAVKGTKFQNVSAELLYIYADLDGDGVAERYPLFDSRLQDYFWNYDNAGLKVLQLRFYQVSTTVM